MDKHYYVVTPDQQKPLDVVGTKVSVLAAATATGSYGITFQQGEEGTGPPPHQHDWDEAFYVLSGAVDFQCGDDNINCVTGTLVHIPRNTVHAFSYCSGGGTMMEITGHDSTSAEMFTAFDAEVDPDTTVPEILDVLRRNGVTVVQ